MHPSERYRVWRNPSSRQWEVLDVGTPGAANVLAGPFKTEAQARTCKNAMCMAYWHGADAIKYGEVII